MPPEGPNDIEDAVTGDPARDRQRFPWLVLVLAIVLMPLVSFLLTELVLIPRIQEAVGSGNSANTSTLPQEDANPRQTASQDLAYSHEFNGIIVNVAGTMGTRYLKISFKVASSDPQLQTILEGRRAALLDTVLSTLSTRTLTELEGYGARNAIRLALVENMNDNLPRDLIENLYFTEFVFQ